MTFDNFIETLSETNATLDYFVDFNKVINNVSKISINLNQLNYLIGKANLKEAVYELYDANPSCFSVLNILIAVRDKDKKKIVTPQNNFKELKAYSQSKEGIWKFFELTGLSMIFKNKNIKNLEDYVFGIEVGLDTNARKNRGGKNMENLVTSILKANSINFEAEVNSSNIPALLTLGVDKKRFDFLIKTKGKSYLVEVNYYNSGGSKLNEVARSYIEIANKVNDNDGLEFVWITDGQGWKSAKNKLNEAYNSIPRVYNLSTMPQFIDSVKTEQ